MMPTPKATNDRRDELVALDRKLGRAWAKAEILLGLGAAGLGLLLGIAQPGSGRTEMDWAFTAAGLLLFVLGGYLAAAGHRSHLYRWQNRNTVTVIDEIRRLQQKG